MGTRALQFPAEDLSGLTLSGHFEDQDPLVPVVQQVEICAVDLIIKHDLVEHGEKCKVLVLGIVKKQIHLPRILVPGTDDFPQDRLQDHFGKRVKKVKGVFICHPVVLGFGPAKENRFLSKTSGLICFPCSFLLQRPGPLPPGRQTSLSPGKVRNRATGY